MARLRKAKEEYLKAHPEQRDAIMAESKSAQAAKQDREKGPGTVNVMGVRIGFREKKQAEAQGLRFDRQGRLLNPYVLRLLYDCLVSSRTDSRFGTHSERSLYFDPVFNPYGAPPPGLPYRARRTFCSVHGQASMS